MIPCFAVYWSLPAKCRWCVLLFFSYSFFVFYNVESAAVLACVTLLSWVGGAVIGRIKSDSKYRKLVFLLSIIACVAVLFIFKYLNFSISIISSVCKAELSPVHLLLPVGVSFYTFQAIGYIADIYHERQSPEKHFGYYAVYMSYFPKLISGPIERAEVFIPQIKSGSSFNEKTALHGAKIFLVGSFKKFVVAEQTAVWVNMVFTDIQSYRGLSLVLASFLFTVQIYCDFSGYSEMAIGMSELLGIKLTVNFRSPYLSASLKEFWSRWHISLSQWLRDYIYFPLGGNRVSSLRHKLNLLITFLVSGLWHGASFTFIFWGFLHGIAQVLETVIRSKKRANEGSMIRRIPRSIICFIFVSLAWIPFRASSIYDAFYCVVHMFDGIFSPISYISDAYRALGLTKGIISLTAVEIFLVAVLDIVGYKCGDAVSEIEKTPKILQWMFFVVLVCATIIVAPINAGSSFIYEQF